MKIAKTATKILNPRPLITTWIRSRNKGRKGHSLHQPKALKLLLNYHSHSQPAEQPHPHPRDQTGLQSPQYREDYDAADVGEEVGEFEGQGRFEDYRREDRDHEQLGEALAR